MKKKLFVLIMALTLCTLMICGVYAHLSEDVSPLTTSYCPRCGTYNYSLYCEGSNRIDSWTESCSEEAGCIITHVLYGTAGGCSSCGYSVEGATHTHVNHSICDISGCPFDAAVSRSHNH